MSLVNAGQKGCWYDSGKGKIAVINAPTRGMELRLLRITEQMVDAKGLSIVVLSIDTGKHVPGSRHYQGRAVDVTDVHLYGQNPEPVSLANPHAVAMVEWFIGHGFVAGHERGPYDAVLFGPVGSKWNATQIPHEHHVHASIKRGVG
jgi:hypothetical protein